MPPDRVPIGSPSSAVKSIVVVTLFPSRMAHMLQPFPRCATPTRPSSPGDHARALHDGEPCEQAVGVVVAADREQIVEPAVADVAAGEGL